MAKRIQYLKCKRFGFENIRSVSSEDECNIILERITKSQIKIISIEVEDFVNSCSIKKSRKTLKNILSIISITVTIIGIIIGLLSISP